jgi:hypothetical protein
VFAFNEDVTANCARKHEGSDNDLVRGDFPDLPNVLSG